MKPAVWEIKAGDCLAVMAEMPDACVQTVVTSPPFYGLRDYGTGTWEGGDDACDHVAVEQRRTQTERGAWDGSFKNSKRSIAVRFKARCDKCGAERIDEQIGLEETPEQYVERLVEVFRGVRRVLREDGTVWLNLGDSYNSADASPRRPSENEGYGKHDWISHGNSVRAFSPDLKPKDLIGIPWRVAFALQADGWYLRSEIIWSKPNPMPESVQDRPTYAHEQVFLLTKAAIYAYDAFAVREEEVTGREHRGNGFSGRQGGTERAGGRSGGDGSREPWTPGGGRNRRSVWEIATVPYAAAHFATFPPKLVTPCVRAGSPEAGNCPECGAPRKRLVQKERVLDGEEVLEGRWELDDGGRIAADGIGHWRKETRWTSLGWRPTCACGAPDGVLPDDLDLIATPTGDSSKPDPSVEVGRAGYSRPRNEGEGTRTITRYQQRRYAEQLRDRVRPTEVTEDAWAHYVRTDRAGARPLPPDLLERMLANGQLEPVEPPEWEPPEAEPSLVFDPFCGAGTTGLVALREGRSFIGAELSEEYVEQARERIRDDAPLFNVGAEC